MAPWTFLDLCKLLRLAIRQHCHQSKLKNQSRRQAKLNWASHLNPKTKEPTSPPFLEANKNDVVPSTEPSKDKKSSKKNDGMYIKKQTMGPFKVVSFREEPRRARMRSRKPKSSKKIPSLKFLGLRSKPLSPRSSLDTTQTTLSPSILKRSKHAEPTSAANLQTLAENTTDSNTSLAAVSWEKACDVTL
jgi:hypothetical protein